MQVTENNVLFTEITTEESAIVSGGLSIPATKNGQIFDLDDYLFTLGTFARFGAGDINSISDAQQDAATQAGLGLFSSFRK